MITFSRAIPLIALLCGAAAALCAPAATAGVCGNAEVRLDQRGGPFDSIPLYDQGDSGICYAVVAASLIDYWRFSHAPYATSLESTSPLEIAVLTGESGETRPGSIDFARVPVAVDVWKRFASQNGRCSHQQLVTGFENLAPTLTAYPGSLNRELTVLVSIQKTVAAYLKEAAPLEALQKQSMIDTIARSETVAFLLERTAQWKKEGKDVPASQKEKDFEQIFSSRKSDVAQRCEQSGANIPLPRSVERALLAGGNAREAMRALLDEACEAGRGYSRFASNESFDDLDELATLLPDSSLTLAEYLPSAVTENLGQAPDRIDELLCAQNPQIVGIAYCSDFVGPTLLGGAPGASVAPDQPCVGRHVATVIGRRVRTGRVQYLVRGTYGTRSHGEGHPPEIEVIDRGESAWIDAELLKANASAAIYLK